VPATTEEFSNRLDRLERGFEELATTVSQLQLPTTGPSERAHALEHVSLRGWLRVSGPTLAVAVFGFSLLWNSHQTMNAQLFEATRSLGRLDGAIERLDARMESFDARLHSFDQTLVRIDGRLDGIDQRLESLDGTLVRLATAVERLEARVATPWP
jgi:tetrahydromethanopterin S-methyltransferase subunit G